MHHLTRRTISRLKQTTRLAREFRCVLALGGNAILKRGEVLSAQNQEEALAQAARSIARVMNCPNKLFNPYDPHPESFPEIIISHGNGPQVGLLALQSMAYTGAPPLPLDVLGAETEGMIGYMLEQALRNELSPEREVATLLTQVQCSPTDTAFAHPSKPVGPVYSQSDAMEAQLKYPEWCIKAVGNHNQWRRLVPSPDPLMILEMNAIRLLVENGVTVITCGGGGVPVIRDPRSRFALYHGVEAVIDKDLSSALLAISLKADALIMLTDVDGVFDPAHYGQANSKVIPKLQADEIDLEEFEAGSMRPKVQAAMRFVNSSDGTKGQRFAAIGALSSLYGVIRRAAGTIFF